MFTWFYIVLPPVTVLIFKGGLPHNVYVETWIDSELIDTSPSIPQPYEWNHSVVQTFYDLEPSVPITISLVVIS